MDARPQRPVRALRLQSDENTAPNQQSKQTLHQRHRSTGTLSNMLGVGGLKAAAKRTAFGDVSNTVKNLAASRDDSAVVGKHIETVKSVAIQDKPAAFLRPAQRPIHNATTKAVQHNAAISAIDPTSSALTSKAEPKQQFPGLKRTQSKKSTVYKDGDVEISQQAQIGTYQSTRPQSTRPESATLPLVRQNLGSRQHHSQSQLKQEQPLLRHTESKILGENNESAVNVQSESVYEDARDYQHGPEQHGGRSNAVERQIILPADAENEAYAKSAVSELPGSWLHEEENDLVYAQQRQLPALPQVSDPEEYWEEDEEEEIYDEQGYTTAHSYRSRGDNTTGGATTVLFPKVTNKVKKELEAAKELVESQRSQEEIEDEAWDTSMVAEYGDEIFAYMRELEIKMLPNAHYMDLQTEIQWSMRSVLMDWLIQVHHRFSLLPETLFLCVNYIDRFLSCKIVSLGKLQLVGATAIFVAAKYEEINCPSVNEIVYMVDGGYTVDEILKAERFMLSMLQFELGWPGPMSFLRRISKADDYDLETRTLAKYFLEVTIMDERFVGSPPSYAAAGAHCFSRLLLKKGDWTPAHLYYSGYTWTQLRPLVSMILECCENPQKHHGAVFDKYSDRRYKRASLFVQSELAKGFTLPPMYFSRLSLPSLEDVSAHMPFETRDSFNRMVRVKN